MSLRPGRTALPAQSVSAADYAPPAPRLDAALMVGAAMEAIEKQAADIRAAAESEAHCSLSEPPYACGFSKFNVDIGA